jgi:predicted lipase
MPLVHWNVIYDPTNDQIQVYENNRVRIFTRQQKSQHFVYRYGKNENTFPEMQRLLLDTGRIATL